MANKILKSISDFFKLDVEDRENEIVDEVSLANNTNKRNDNTIQLAEVIDFIRELEAYYTNDIFKLKSSYINSALLEDQVILFKKKIKQYENVVKVIIQIKDNLIQKERECKDLWGKASYSFYEELESAKLEDVFSKAFEIVVQINSINVIPELDEIIRKRLEMYKENWKLDDYNIPKNTSLRLVERNGNVETYQFGDFRKNVIDIDLEKDLLPEQLSAINKLNIVFQKPPFGNIWVRCTTINRNQLETLKRSTVFKNDWENGIEEEIVYDIVDCKDIEYYIRAMLQLLLLRNSYIIIAIIIPNDNMIDSVELNLEEKRVRVIDKMKFLLHERINYGDNLQFEIISRKSSLEKLEFYSYSDFIKNFLKVDVKRKRV